MKSKKVVFFSLIFVSVSILCSILHFTGAFTWSENKSYDNRIAVTSHFLKPAEEIAVVILDQDSLVWAKEEYNWGWPWPREAYARMVDYFNAGNAASVAFDLVYTEPSVYGPEDDAEFARASLDYGRVVQTVFYETHNPNEVPTLPIDILKESAGILGTVQSEFDEDGVVRRNRFYSTSIYNEPSLAVASLLVSGQEFDESVVPKIKNGGMYIRFQDDINRFVPYNAKQILQSFEAYKSGNISEVFEEEDDYIPPEQFENMYVFFGLRAAGLFDVCSTPIEANYLGVGVHICQMDTILNGRYIHDLSGFLVVLIIFVMSFFGGLMGERSVNGKTSSFIGHFSILFAELVVYLFLAYLILYAGYILPVTGPILGLLLSYVACLAKNYLIEGRQRRYLKHAFSQYLSPQVIDNLIDNPDMLKLGGEKREISVYFSDIQGFTSISENLNPEDLTELLNTYLSAMTDIILTHGGTIDKYEGDAIIAFWNAPTFQEDHAKRALEAAMECQATLASMRDELMAKAGKPMYQRIGLNTGEAVVGNMGSSKRFDYTMLGDTVNLASRLEGINKQFGTYTMCSKATMEKAMEHGCSFKFRELADIAVVGRKEGVHVFEPMEEAEFERRTEELEVFEEALKVFTDGEFVKAKKLFESIASKDPAAAKYIDKCDAFINNPPENWDGILRATEK